MRKSGRCDRQRRGNTCHARFGAGEVMVDFPKQGRRLRRMAEPRKRPTVAPRGNFGYATGCPIGTQLGPNARYGTGVLGKSGRNGLPI
jgi:hypothetical protein